MTSTRIAACMLLLASSVAAHAQVPHIVGTWKLNVEASRLPGPPPQSHVRRYSLAEDGATLIGLAVVVDAQGNPSFLQFAAKPDGKDYPEFDASSAARYLIDGSKPPRTYAETPIDSHTVDWVDKADGRVIAQGRKWVSADGQTLSFTVDSQNQRGEAVQYLLVFDRQ
jgi:hypothetical protein